MDDAQDQGDEPRVDGQGKCQDELAGVPGKGKTVGAVQDSKLVDWRDIVGCLGTQKVACSVDSPHFCLLCLSGMT